MKGKLKDFWNVYCHIHIFMLKNYIALSMARQLLTVIPKQYRDFRGIHVCGIVYHVCGIVYHICGSFDPQMWYTIPHMWYTQKYFFGILTMIPMPKIQKLF